MLGRCLTKLGNANLCAVVSVRVYRGFQFHSVEAALDAIREMIQAGFRPAVVRLYDAFDSLPALVYARGFVSAYARAIGVDAEAVARSYMPRLEAARTLSRAVYSLT